MKRYFFFLIIVSLFACTPKNAHQEEVVKMGIPSPVESYDHIPANVPKNIIFMVGDGMGITQITAGLYANKNKLNLERFNVIGLHKSHSSSHLVTDSAAGATAFASGVKTYNGAIGVTKDSLPCVTILELAEKKGLKTGMVSTSTIVHATPASFIAHVKSRKMYEDIASWFLKTDIDFFIGGGKKYFDRREKDERNISKELEGKGYYVSDYFKEDLSSINSIDKAKKFAYFTADDDPLPVLQGRDYLELASKMAYAHLKTNSENGFFLMIEGSQIDWGGHANNSDYIVSEMLDFDRTIGSILDYAEKDGETLVVVTADHETGGYAINSGSTMDSLVTAFTTDYHTADLIPVFAFGPGASEFAGIYENTALFTKMKKALRL